MSCLNPKIGHLTYDAGKGKYKVQFVPGTFNDMYNDFDSWNAFDKSGFRTIIVPCGRCIECRLSYSRDWANRLCLEAESYARNQCFMLTLTYRDELLPTRILEDDGMTKVSHPLVKSDLQNFIRDLRRACSSKIRYFGCGEYGDQNGRPHYHLIIFGLDLSDLKFYSRSSSGENVFSSDFISKVWKHGLAWVSEFSWNSAAYVARYVMKKQYGLSATYEEDGLVPEFCIMSRRPGIGYEWFEKHKEDLFESFNFSVLKGDKAVVQPLPRYFLKLLKKDGFLISLQRDKQYQRSVGRVWKRVQNTTLTPDQQHVNDLEDVQLRVSRLKRQI